MAARTRNLTGTGTDTDTGVTAGTGSSGTGADLLVLTLGHCEILVWRVPLGVAPSSYQMFDVRNTRLAEVDVSDPPAATTGNMVEKEVPNSETASDWGTRCHDATECGEGVFAAYACS